MELDKNLKNRSNRFCADQFIQKTIYRLFSASKQFINDYIYIVMNLHLDQDLLTDHQQLGYLLDCSDIVQNRSQQQSEDFSISKDKLNLSEKERTREESYEDICKQINQAKLEQVQLNQQLQQLRQNTYKAYLGPFHQEFQSLDQQNVALRAQLNQCRKKVKEDKAQRFSNRSSLKPRSSINSVYGDENAKTHMKAARKQASPNMILKKKQNKVTESSANLGRSQIVSPRVHRRRESQLTERKIQQNKSIGNSVNASYYQEKNSTMNIKQSVSKVNLKKQAEKKNIFVQILQKMLLQEKNKENQKYSQLYLQMNERKSMQKAKQQVLFINQLQEEIQMTNEKLQMLSIVLNRYQSQIKGMDVNLKGVHELVHKLYSVKGLFVEMQKKCADLFRLRKEVNEKQQFLIRRKEEIAAEDKDAANKNISSVETMIKIITNNSNKSFKCKSSSLYFNYCKEIKALFKQNTQEHGKRQQKTVKVRQMIEGIREGRKKFNQLIQIYEGRIAKLQEKINRAKGQQLLRSDKSHRK